MMVREHEKQSIAEKYGHKDFDTFLVAEYQKRSTTDISKIIGVSVQTIWRWMHDKGIARRPRGGARTKKRAVSFCEKCGRNRGINIRLCNKCIKYLGSKVESACGFENVI